MREVRCFLIGLVSVATWPAYLVLVAYAAKVAPWPRDLAWPAFVLLLWLAGALLVANAGRTALRRRGWAEEVMLAPREVTRQIRRVVLTLAIAGFVLLMPEVQLGHGLIAPGGRPISASSLGRLLVLGFELTCWVLAYRLLRKSSPLLAWLSGEPARLGWAGRHLRALAWTILSGLTLVLALDAAGFRFSSKRLLFGGALSVALAGSCGGAYRLLLRLIDLHAWRWKKSEGEPVDPSTTTETETADDAGAKLRTLARAVVILAGVLVGARVWNVDLALFRYIGEQHLWTMADQKVVVGDVFKMTLILFVTLGIWRYLSTFFTVAVFPRMTDDPGIRYAVVTLCRYAVLAVGSLSGLSAIHLGIERIGVVLAALGVGLGFGLQEIVSNFVSGIILLLERPIRVGDLVSVGDMTGKVDRINMRATTIINGDNQSMIIPNRAFITGNLVNWTHKDKIVRVVLRIHVMHRTDADKVTDLMLAIAHEDPDVLNNPVPAAFLDTVGNEALNFVLYAYVPEPSLMGRVRHRLFGQIQRRFEAAGIEIPLPTRELRVHAMNADHDNHAIPRPHFRGHEARAHAPVPPPAIVRAPLPAPAEECHRGVDE
jgi:small-conductance mechanosensitive channel